MCTTLVVGMMIVGLQECFVAVCLNWVDGCRHDQALVDIIQSVFGLLDRLFWWFFVAVVTTILLVNMIGMLLHYIFI